MTDIKNTIKLNDRVFEIPDLGIKHIRQIDWRFMRSGAAFRAPELMTQRARDDLFDIVHVGLTAKYPEYDWKQDAKTGEFIRPEFDELNIRLVEAITAVPVIIMQTHMFKPKAEATPATGEAPPATPAQPTGIQ